MKNKILLLIVTISLLASCGPPKDRAPKYPEYKLGTMEVVPDSLMVEYREWIQETVRAASSRMSGGDYEDVDQTIKQSKWTADDIFSKRQACLRMKMESNGYFVDIAQKDLSEHQMKIFLKLSRGEL